MRSLLLATTLVVAGCGGSAPPPAGSARVDVGTGIEQFVPITDGDSVPIIMGPQGGYHIWGSLQVANMPMRDMRVHFSLTRDGDAMPLTTRNDVIDLTEVSPSLGQFLGSAVFLPDPAQLRDQPCHFEITVTASDGSTSAGTRRIVPR